MAFPWKSIVLKLVLKHFVRDYKNGKRELDQRSPKYCNCVLILWIIELSTLYSISSSDLFYEKCHFLFEGRSNCMLGCRV